MAHYNLRNSAARTLNVKMTNKEVIDLNKLNKEEVLDRFIDLNKQASEWKDALDNYRRYENVELSQRAMLESQKEMLEVLKRLSTAPPTSTATSQKRLPMNSSQPTFSGNKTENVNDWLTTTHTNLCVANVDNADKVLIASTYLRVRALQFYNSISKTITAWADFSPAMEKQFLPANYTQI